MDSRKRKVTSEVASTTSSLVNRRRVTGRRKDAERLDGQNEPFRKLCGEYLATDFTVLNTWFRDAISKERSRIDSSDSMLSYGGICTEYVRVAGDIKRRYSSLVPPSEGSVTCVGEMLVMGSDDLNQIGARLEGVVSNEGVYLPFFKSEASGLRNIRAISAGGTTSVAIDIDGYPYTWGSSDEGALGREILGDDNDDFKIESSVGGIVPEHVPGLVSGFVTKDGLNEDGTIIQAAAGDSHILFLSLAGNVYQCGTYKDVDSGKFCDMNIVGFNAKPVHVHTIPDKVKAIFTKVHFNVALLQDDTIVTWGFGNCGELARSANMTEADANGTYDLFKKYYFDLETDTPNLDIIENKFLLPLPPIWQVKQKMVVVGVATGAFHLLVTAREPNSSKSYLFSSGLNQYGQLGHRDQKNRHELTKVEALSHKNMLKVSAGTHHSLALSFDGTELYSFGRSDYGQLGIGPIPGAGDYTTVPTLVRFPAVPGSNPPAYQIITSIECGHLTSMAITIENNIYTWGFNETGATGHPCIDNVDINVPTLLDLNKLRQESTIKTYEASGGGQHMLLLVKRFR